MLPGNFPCRGAESAVFIVAAVAALAVGLSVMVGCEGLTMDLEGIDPPSERDAGDADAGDPGDPGDAGDEDAGDVGDTGDADVDDCEPESVQQLCQQHGYECGAWTVYDDCGDERDIDCSELDGFGCDPDDRRICDDGTCVCDAGYNPCDGECVDFNSPDHCGGCNESCGDLEVCDAGTCADDCPDDEVICGGSCVDFETDGDHCGECGNECGDDEICEGGTCVCEEITCGPGDCGQFSNACGNTKECGDCGEDESCEQNQCVCDDPCTGFECGDATNACESGDIDCGSCSSDDCQECSDNQCVSACNDNEVCDDGDCVDCINETDCGADEICTDSNTCECPDVECDSDDCGIVSNACGNTDFCGDCGSDKFCENTKCVECTDDNDCAGDESCTDNQCVPVCDTSGDIGGGDGTSSEPYLICSTTHLDYLEENPDDHFVLVEDIAFSPDEVFSDAIVDNFSGNLDGQSHEIEGLTIDSLTYEIGMIGELEDGGHVTDLALIGVDIEGGDDVGALAGVNEGTVENVTVDGDIEGNQRVGGIVGTMNEGGELHASLADVDVTGDASSIGGLVGTSSDAEITGSEAQGEVEGEVNVGGLVGSHSGGEITDSHAAVDVTADYQAGGLIGHNHLESTIEDCHATGDVVSTANVSSSLIRYVGGLVGLQQGDEISRCYATGDVDAGNVDYVGGLVGWNQNTNVVDSYATGQVEGRENVGGLAGGHSGAGVAIDRTYSYSPGGIVGEDDVGPLVGDPVNQDVIDSYWHTDNVAGDADSVIGEELDEDEFKSEDNFDDDWHFDNVWVLEDEDLDRPELR